MLYICNTTQIIYSCEINMQNYRCSQQNQCLNIKKKHAVHNIHRLVWGHYVRGPQGNCPVQCANYSQIPLQSDGRGISDYMPMCYGDTARHRGSQLYFHITRYVLKRREDTFWGAKSGSRVSAPFFVSNTVQSLFFPYRCFLLIQ